MSNVTCISSTYSDFLNGAVAINVMAVVIAKKSFKTIAFVSRSIFDGMNKK